MKKQQIILVSSGVGLLCLIYFFGNTIPPKKNPGAVAAAAGTKEISSKTILDALECVTKKSENEDYDAFTERVKENPLAIKVKINDLLSNMDLTRIEKVKEKDVERFNRYLKAYNELVKLI